MNARFGSLLLIAACGGSAAPAAEAPTNVGTTSGGGPTQPITVWAKRWAPNCPPDEFLVTVFVDEREVGNVRIACPPPDPSGMTVRKEGWDPDSWVEGPKLAIEHGSHTIRAVAVGGYKRREKELSATFPTNDKTLAVFIRPNALVVLLGEAERP